MREVKRADLEIGQQYYTYNSTEADLLEFIGEMNGSIYFKAIGNVHLLESTPGIVGFNLKIGPQNLFYQKKESMISLTANQLIPGKQYYSDKAKTLSPLIFDSLDEEGDPYFTKLEGCSYPFLEDHNKGGKIGFRSFTKFYEEIND